MGLDLTSGAVDSTMHTLSDGLDTARPLYSYSTLKQEGPGHRTASSGDGDMHRDIWTGYRRTRADYSTSLQYMYEYSCSTGCGPVQWVGTLQMRQVTVYSSPSPSCFLAFLAANRASCNFAASAS